MSPTVAVLGGGLIDHSLPAQLRRSRKLQVLHWFDFLPSGLPLRTITRNIPSEQIGF